MRSKEIVTGPEKDVSLIFLLRHQFRDQSALTDAGLSAYEDDTAAGRIQAVEQLSQHRQLLFPLQNHAGADYSEPSAAALLPSAYGYSATLVNWVPRWRANDPFAVRFRLLHRGSRRRHRKRNMRRQAASDLKKLKEILDA